jgi:Flp pilus assembly protein TadD
MQANLPRSGRRKPRSWIAVAGLCLIALALYAPNLSNDLVYDDHETVTNNEAAHGLENTVRIFTTPSWWSSQASYVRHYRPITTWSYALNYSLHGLRPEGYHLLNNLLHGLAGGTLFLVLAASGMGAVASGIAAVLFLAHPIHTEAVNWVNCRADILAGVFILGSLFFHVRSIAATGIRRVWLIGLELVSFLLAGLSKETGFMTPFVVLAWDLTVREGVSWKRTVRYLRADAWREYLCLCLVLVGLLSSRALLVGGTTEATVTEMASPLGDATFPERLLTGSYVIWRYTMILAWPGTLSVDYSPNEIAAVTSLSDVRAMVGLGTVAAYLTLLVAVRRRPVVCFSLAASAVVFAPGANIVFPVGTIMAERLMYLPVAAVTVPLAYAMTALGRLRGGRFASPVLLGLVLVGYSGRTLVRTRDWRDEFSLFRSALAASPRSAMAHKNLASVLQQAGRCEEAIPLALHAVEILYEFPDAHLVLGNCYFCRGDYPGAVKEYRTTLSLVPGHATAHLNLGAAYHVLGRLDEALREFETAASLDPRLALAWFNRVHTLVGLHRLDDADRVLAEALVRFPAHACAADARAKISMARTQFRP